MKKIIIAFALLITSQCFSQESNDSLHQKLFPVAALQQDLDSLYKILNNNHPDLYRFADRYEVGMAWEEAKNNIKQPMTRWEFIRVVAPLVNQFRDGHTNLSYDFESEELDAFLKRDGRFFPFRVNISNGEAIITDHWENSGSPLAKRKLLVVNGKPVGEIIKALTALTAGDYPANVEATLSRLFPFFLWANYGWEKEFNITTSGRKGLTNNYLVPGVPAQVYFDKSFPKQDWTMQVNEKESLAIISCSSYRNMKTASSFIDSAFTVVKAKRLKHVALDIRRNGGGNSAIGNYFLSYITSEPFADVVSKTIRDGSLLNQFTKGTWVHNMLTGYRAMGVRDGDLLTREFKGNEPEKISHPENRFNGKFYLLTGPSTYSSAHMTALAVKCNRIGVIIGEPTGERIDLTGETIGFSLPNTKLIGYCATAVYRAACGDGSQAGVKPDIALSSLPQQFLDSNDPVLAYLKELVKIFN